MPSISPYLITLLIVIWSCGMLIRVHNVSGHENDCRHAAIDGSEAQICSLIAVSAANPGSTGPSAF